MKSGVGYRYHLTPILYLVILIWKNTLLRKLLQRNKYMKKQTNKQYHDSYSLKHHNHNISRDNLKHHKKYAPMSRQDIIARGIEAMNPLKKILTVPNIFSFIHNPEESIDFVNSINSYVEGGKKSFFISMKYVEDLTVDVLLYIVSMDKIFKQKYGDISLTIRIPQDKRLKYLVYTSGIQEYFKGDGGSFPIPKDGFLPIMDGGRSGDGDIIDDAITCQKAVDFTESSFDFNTNKKDHLTDLYVALAELMENTDEHAYTKDDCLNDWYLYANKIQDRVIFYYFDNGEGILNTIRTTTMEKALKKFGYTQEEKLLKSAFDGELRSNTKLPYRGKGLLDINHYLENEDIVAFMVLTNNAMYSKLDGITSSKKLKNNFQGTFFLWVIE